MTDEQKSWGAAGVSVEFHRGESWKERAEKAEARVRELETKLDEEVKAHSRTILADLKEMAENDALRAEKSAMTKANFKAEFARLLPEVSAADADSMADYWWEELTERAKWDNEAGLPDPREAVELEKEGWPG